MRIGVVGLGRMGSAIALRLLETSHAVTVWNRSPERATPLAEAGAAVAATPAELARACDVIVSIVFDAPALDAVFHGANGLLSVDVAGRLFIEMTTVRPAVEQGLAEAVRAKGAAFIECPVGGTVTPARAGKLIGLAGGEVADFERARPVLDDLCRRLEHVGPVGAGSAMKLAINLPLIVFWQALGEANALVRHLDRDPAWLIDLFSDSSGGANVLKLRGAAVAAALAGKGFATPSFDVDSLRKDLRTMVEEAGARGFALPLVAQTLAVFDTASAEGWGKRDCTALPVYWPTKIAGHHPD
jgi:3-hydroxyisobutyrate dehydrogenase